MQQLARHLIAAWPLNKLTDGYIYVPLLIYNSSNLQLNTHALCLCRFTVVDVSGAHTVLVARTALQLRIPDF